MPDRTGAHWFREELRLCCLFAGHCGRAPPDAHKNDSRKFLLIQFPGMQPAQKEVLRPVRLLFAADAWGHCVVQKK